MFIVSPRERPYAFYSRRLIVAQLIVDININNDNIIMFILSLLYYSAVISPTFYGVCC